MKKKIIFIVFLIILCLIVGLLFFFLNKNSSSNNQNNNNSSSEVQKPVINENDELYIKLLMLENKNENVIFSPLSIRHALGLVEEGSRGDTKEEIDKVLGDYTLNKYSNIKDHLSLANSLFIRDSFKPVIDSNYVNNVKNKYGADIMFDSFENANNVNNWISDKTFEMLKNIIKDETVKDPNLRMLLVNALAVDMEWESPFDANDTHPYSFTNNSKKMNVTMMSSGMSRGDDISYYKDDKIQAFGKTLKKYGDYQFEFIGICPENLDEFIKNINKEQVDKIVNNLNAASNTKDGVIVRIPRFEYDYTLPLVDDLKTIGIKTMFDQEKADLSGITSKEDLFISDGIHKAKIEFSEKGLKAAAVTVFYAKANSAMEQPEPVEIVFDKPFMYLIREKNTNDIWFVGTVYQPNLWENDKVNYEVR